MTIETDKPLLGYNTFGMDVRAKVFVEYGTETELAEALRLCRSRYAGLPLLHIGDGSNLLFLGDYGGVALRSAIKGAEVLADDGDEVTVRVGAGETHDSWIEYAIAHGWHGLENLSLIPGQVGASAVQNIGAYGAEACDVICRVEGVSLSDGSKREWDVAECDYGYRTSVFKNSLKGQYAITHVTYRLSKTFVPRLDYGGLCSALRERGLDSGSVDARQVRELITETRREKLPDPAVTGNAGSFFTNPLVDDTLLARLLADDPLMPHFSVGESCSKIPAAWLIEQCGWKGRSLGHAGTHPRQPLVLVNLGGATGDEVMALCRAISDDVKNRFGITLTPEVNIIK